MSPEALAPESDHRLPRYHRVREALSAEIAARRWKPEEAIPSEGEIAETHQVSIGTVRKAIDSLVADGVLERFQGKGTFVRRPDFQSSFFRFFRFASAGGAARVPVSRILKREETLMPVVVAEALGLVLDRGGRAGEPDDFLGELLHRHLPAIADVVRACHVSGGSGIGEGADDIGHMDEVTGLAAVAVDANGFVAQGLRDEDWDRGGIGGAWILARSEDVEEA